MIKCYYLFIFSWYQLSNKPGKSKSGPRGEIELRLGFIVAGDNVDHSDVKTLSEVNNDSIEPRWSDNIHDVVEDVVEDDILDEMLDEMRLTPVSNMITSSSSSVSSSSSPVSSEETLINRLEKTGENKKQKTETKVKVSHDQHEVSWAGESRFRMQNISDSCYTLFSGQSLSRTILNTCLHVTRGHHHLCSLLMFIFHCKTLKAGRVNSVQVAFRAYLVVILLLWFYSDI